MDGAVDGYHRPWLDAGEDAAFAEGDSLHLGIVDHHQFDNLCVSAELVCRTGTFGSKCSELLHRLRPQIVDHEIKPGFDQIDGHGLAHVAQPDKSNACGHDKFSQYRPARCGT